MEIDDMWETRVLPFCASLGRGSFLEENTCFMQVVGS